MVLNQVPLKKMKDKVGQLKTVIAGGKRIIGPINAVIKEEWELFQEYLTQRTKLNDKVKDVEGAPLAEAVELFNEVKMVARSMKRTLEATEKRVAELKALEEKEKMYATLIRVISRYLESKGRITVVDGHHQSVKDVHGEFIACEAEAVKIMRDVKVLKREVYIELHNFLTVHIARLNSIIAAKKIDAVKKPLAAINSQGLTDQFERCENICVVEDKDMMVRFGDLEMKVKVVGISIDDAMGTVGD
jgi:hypothetical protein